VLRCHLYDDVTFMTCADQIYLQEWWAWRELYIHFCPTCSTQITATTERFPDRRVMMIGT